MEYLAEISKQGFGYLLFVVSCLVIVHLYKKVDAANEKRVNDLIAMKDAYTKIASEQKDATNETNNIIRSMVQTNIEIATNVKTIIGEKK